MDKRRKKSETVLEPYQTRLLEIRSAIEEVAVISARTGSCGMLPSRTG